MFRSFALALLLHLSIIAFFSVAYLTDDVSSAEPIKSIKVASVSTKDFNQLTNSSKKTIKKEPANKKPVQKKPVQKKPVKKQKPKDNHEKKVKEQEKKRILESIKKQQMAKEKKRQEWLKKLKKRKAQEEQQSKLTRQKKAEEMIIEDNQVVDTKLPNAGIEPNIQSNTNKVDVNSQTDRLNEIISSYSEKIRYKMSQQWIKPLRSKNQALSTTVAISLATSGTIEKVKVIKTSGLAAFDNSVLNALWKVKTLPLPKEEKYLVLFTQDELELEFNNF